MTASKDKTVKLPRARADWDAIEPDWRAGIKTKLQISKEYGVSRAALDKHFDKAGIERDLAGKIQAAADSMVTHAVVTQQVTPDAKVSEKAIISANAEAQFHIRMEHRQDIGRSRKLFSALMDELELTTGNRDLFEQLGELMDRTSEDDNGKVRQDKLNEIYQKVIAMPMRVESAKKLVETLEKLVRMEREALGIDKTPPDGASAMAKFLADLSMRGSRLPTGGSE